MPEGFGKLITDVLTEAGKAKFATPDMISTIENEYKGDYKKFVQDVMIETGKDTSSVGEETWRLMEAEYGLGSAAEVRKEPEVETSEFADKAVTGAFKTDQVLYQQPEKVESVEKPSDNVPEVPKPDMEWYKYVQANPRSLDVSDSAQVEKYKAVGDAINKERLGKNEFKTTDEAVSKLDATEVFVRNSREKSKVADYFKLTNEDGKNLGYRSIDVANLPERETQDKKYLDLAESLLSRSKETINTLKEAKDRGILSNLGAGTASGVVDYIKDYTNLFDQLRDNKLTTELTSKLKRINEGSGESITPGEAAIIQTLQTVKETAKVIDQELPEAYKIGKMVGNSMGFMLEFGLTGGAASSAKAPLLRMAAGAGASGKSAKVATGITLGLVQAGLQTAAMPTTWKEAAKNSSNGQSLGSAIANAYVDTGIQNWSERWFMGKIPTGDAAASAMARFARTMGNAMAGKRGVVGRASGIIEEFAEEKGAEFLSGVKSVAQGKVTAEEVNKQFWDYKNNLRTLGVVGIISGTMAAAQEGERLFVGAALNTGIDKAGEGLHAPLKRQIDEFVANRELTISEIQELVLNAAAVANVENKEETLKQALVYTTLKMRKEAFDEAARAKKPKTGVFVNIPVGEQVYRTEQLDGSLYVQNDFSSEEEAMNVGKSILSKMKGREEQYKVVVDGNNSGFVVRLDPVTPITQEDASKDGSLREGGEQTEGDEIGLGNMPGISREEEVTLKPTQDGKEEEKGLLVNEPKVVADLVNRPATLTKFGETEIPAEQGNVYQDGQQIVFESESGKIYELGNVDEIKDSSLSDLGLVPEVVKVVDNNDGTFTFNDEVLVPAEAHAPSSIKYAKNGAVSKVTMRTQDGSVTRTLKGQDAEDAAYSILMANSPDLDTDLKEVSISGDGKTATVKEETIDLTGSLNIPNGQKTIQPAAEVPADIATEKTSGAKGKSRVRAQVKESSKLSDEEIDTQLAVIDAMFSTMRPDLTLDQAYDFYIGEVTSDPTKFGTKGEISQGDKGAIMWKNGKALIGLFKTSDASTLLHEAGGHIGRVILEEKASTDEKFKKDYDTAALWSGATQEGGKWKWSVEAEEKFARSFEKYLYDGVLPENAPDALKKVFDVIKQMMMSVYDFLSRDINFKLSPEVRKVFDNMLVAQKEQGGTNAQPKGEVSPKASVGGKETILKQITPEQAKGLDYETSLPDTKEFKAAVEGTEGAKITEDGLLLDTVRFQQESQAGAMSVRTGVFYLPKGDKNIKYYKSSKTSYGGQQKIEGTTLLKRPLFVSGATGGKAPESAYDRINGKGSYLKMRSDVLNTIGYMPRNDNYMNRLVRGLLEKYRANSDVSWDIVKNSTKGSTLPYAIQENIVAEAVREAGYDSVLGYSKRRDGSLFISELFDVRETTYPSKDYESEIHPKFPPRGILKQSITVEGVERPTVNSNGKPIHPTKEGIVNFWKWFGDSKVVDTDGRPLVVYHGSFRGNFDSFLGASKADGSLRVEGAVYFHSNPEGASKWADTGWGRGWHGSVFPVYLKIINPAVFKSYEVWIDFVSSIDPKINDGAINEVADWAGNPLSLEHKGYRGAFGTQYAVFSPTQIKSATGNVGTFDVTKPEILFQRSTPIEDSEVKITRNKKVDGKLTQVEENASIEEKEAMSAIVLKVGEFLSTGKAEQKKFDAIDYSDTFADVKTFKEFEKRVTEDLSKKNKAATLKDVIAEIVKEELSAKDANGNFVITDAELKRQIVKDYMSAVRSAKTVYSTLRAAKRVLDALSVAKKARTMGKMKAAQAKMRSMLDGGRDKFGTIRMLVDRLASISPEFVLQGKPGISDADNERLIDTYNMYVRYLTKTNPDIPGDPSVFAQFVNTLEAVTRMEDVMHSAQLLNEDTSLSRKEKVDKLAKEWNISTKLAGMYIDRAEPVSGYRSEPIGSLLSMGAEGLMDKYDLEKEEAQEILDEIKGLKDQIKSAQKSISKDTDLGYEATVASLDSLDDMTIYQLTNIAQAFDKMRRGMPSAVLNDFVVKAKAKTDAKLAAGMFTAVIGKKGSKNAAKMRDIVLRMAHFGNIMRVQNFWGRRFMRDIPESIAKLQPKNSLEYMKTLSIGKTWIDQARAFSENTWFAISSASNKKKTTLDRLQRVFQTAVGKLNTRIENQNLKAKIKGKKSLFDIQEASVLHMLYRKQEEINATGTLSIGTILEHSKAGIRPAINQEYLDKINSVEKKLRDRGVLIGEGAEAYIDMEKFDTVMRTEFDSYKEWYALDKEIRKISDELEAMGYYVESFVRGGSFDAIPGYYPQYHEQKAEETDAEAFFKIAFSSNGTKAPSMYKRQGNQNIDLDSFGTFNRHISTRVRDYYMTQAFRQVKDFFDAIEAEISTSQADPEVIKESLVVLSELRDVVIGNSERGSIFKHQIQGYRGLDDAALKVVYKGLRNYTTTLLETINRPAQEGLSNIPMAIGYAKELKAGLGYMKRPKTGLSPEEEKIYHSIVRGTLIAEDFGSDQRKLVDRYTEEEYEHERAFSDMSSRNYTGVDRFYDFMSYNDVTTRVSKIGDPVISFGDRAVVLPIWNGALNLKFKEITGRELDRDAYYKDRTYKLENKEALKQAVMHADAIAAKITNPASKAGANINDATGRRNKNIFARSFDTLFFGFGAAESNNFRTAIDTYRSEVTTTKQKQQALYLMGRLVLRNAIYQEVAALAAGALFMSDDDWKKLKAKHLTGEYWLRSLVNPFMTLGFGGFSNTAKIPIFYGTEWLNKILTEKFGHTYDPYSDSFVNTVKLTRYMKDWVSLLIPGSGKEIGRVYEASVKDQDFTASNWLGLAQLLTGMTHIVPLQSSVYRAYRTQVVDKNPQSPANYYLQGLTIEDMLNDFRVKPKEEFDNKKSDLINKYIIESQIEDQEMRDYAKFFSNVPSQGKGIAMLEKIAARPDDWDNLVSTFGIRVSGKKGHRVTGFKVNVNSAYDFKGGKTEHVFKPISEELMEAYLNKQSAK